MTDKIYVFVRRDLRLRRGGWLSLRGTYPPGRTIRPSAEQSLW